MAGTPAPTTTPITPPDGSVGSDVDLAIDSQNLAILSNSAASSLLATTNLGASVTSRVNNTLDLIRSFESFEAFLLDGTQLDSLSSGNATTNYTIANTGSSDYVRIILILNSFTPSAPSPAIVFNDGTNSYSVSISTTTSNKRVELNNIPASFVSSFQVENQTGTSFASYGNSILVVNL